MNEKMKNALNETLESGEKVVWESAVQPFGLFDGKEGRSVLLTWVICAVAICGLMAAYATRNGKGFAIYLVSLAALAIIVLTPILSYRQTVGQRYYITSRRALTIRPDGSTFKMDLENVGESRLYKVDCGGAALALGSMLLAEKDKQLRWRANHPLESSDYVLRGMVFYRPERAEDALRLLSSETAKEA